MVEEEVVETKFCLDEDNPILNMGNDFGPGADLSAMYNRPPTASKKQKPEVDPKSIYPIPEAIEYMPPDQEEVGRIMARLIEVLWERRRVRREAKEMRQMLLKLPV